MTVVIVHGVHDTRHSSAQTAPAWSFSRLCSQPVRLRRSLALAHDFAVMRSDRGYFCRPEVDLGRSFTPGMNALTTSRPPKVTAHEAMSTGRRYGAGEAVPAGIGRQAVPEAEVLPAAVAL